MSTTFTPVVGSGFASSPVSFDRKNDTVAANVHSPTPSTPVTGMSSHIPQVDSAILGTETLEQREKFTLFKIDVNNGQRPPWVIYRRYTDFVLLNKKLRRLFPYFRLSLPGKRIFRDNFDKGFIQRRQQGLEEFMRNLLSHRDVVQSAPVQRFFRLGNPPQPCESLEASQSYCQSLEHSLAQLRLKNRQQGIELVEVKTDLARIKYHRDESKDLADHYQKQHAFVEEATKSLKEQLSMSQENEKRLQDELNRIKEDIKSEKASAQAARLLEKQKREKLIKNEVLLFRQQHEEINKHINSLMAAISQLPKVNVEINGKHFEVKADDGVGDKASNLSQAVSDSRSQIERIHRSALEMYTQEIGELKEELSRAEYQVKSRLHETDSLKKQIEEIQKRCHEGLVTQDNYIREVQKNYGDLQRYINATEEKYFYSLVIGVKLNMQVCGYKVGHINELKPQTLFERVRNHGITIEHWPSWVSRELATASEPTS